eukprot:SAG22_NODE_1504_length_4277_cov_4.550503_2_plen_230_part_00
MPPQPPQPPPPPPPPPAASASGPQQPTTLVGRPPPSRPPRAACIAAGIPPASTQPPPRSPRRPQPTPHRHPGAGWRTAAARSKSPSTAACTQASAPRASCVVQDTKREQKKQWAAFFRAGDRRPMHTAKTKTKSSHLAPSCKEPLHDRTVPHRRRRNAWNSFESIRPSPFVSHSAKSSSAAAEHAPHPPAAAAAAKPASAGSKISSPTIPECRAWWARHAAFHGWARSP